MAKKDRWPLANEVAAKRFEEHILSYQMQGYIKEWRMDNWADPVFYPRGVDNLGQKLYEPYVLSLFYWAFWPCPWLCTRMWSLAKTP